MNEKEVIAAGRQGIVINDQRNIDALKTQDSQGNVIAQLTMKRKDNSVFEVEISSKEFTEKENSKLLVSVRDISHRLNQKKELELINEKLRVIGGLTRHDVGNKLAVVKGNCYLLKKQVGDNTTMSRYLEGIVSAVDEAIRLFELGHFYEKIGSEQTEIVDVEKCFNEAAALFANLKEITLINKCHGLNVMADSLLRELFYNLIDNSLKHGEKVNQIKLHYIKNSNVVKLFYEDDGVGVSEANKLKLFTKGFSTGRSSGLGLKLIKRMMEVYGWNLSEEGKPGEGAKFVMTIPIKN
jgi:signal transduction histidine kinase